MHAQTSRLTALSAAALVALSVMAAPAQAFSDDEARRAILELRAQVQQMKEQNQQARLQLADQMDLLRQEVASLRGRVEELGYQPPQADNGNGNAPQAPQSGDPQERAVYSEAADQYRSGQYKEAAAGFSSFVQSYPDSELVASAQFYLGSSQYASKDFKSSIQTMETLVKDHPKDPRAADALLVVAADQIELNNIEGAKSSLQRIIKEYPNSSAAETAKSRMKLL